MKYNPGQKVEISGIYAEHTPQEGVVTQVTCVKGEVFPPSLQKGNYYKLVKEAKHFASEGEKTAV